MDRQHQQWLPPNHHIPSNPSYPISQASIQTLEDQLSRISLSGSGVAFSSPFPNLNPNLNQPQASSSPWELDRLRTYFANKVHEAPTYPGSSSYIHKYSGSGLGSGLGSSFTAPLPRDYSSIIPRNLDRGRRVVHDLCYNNDHSHSVLNSNLYNIFLNDNTSYHRHNLNNNHHTNPLRGTSSTRNNNRSRVYNNNGATTTNPLSLINNPISWEEIKGKVVYFANDMALSKLLIKKFELGQMEGTKMVVSELKEGVSHILFNQVGSQFFQRFLDFLDHHDIFELTKAVMGNQQVFVDICLDNQGTRAAQKLLTFMNKNSREEKAILLSAIRGVVVTLTKNMNGYHFIEELLKDFQGVYEVIGPLLSEVCDRCVDIAMEKSGCIAIQYCIQHGQGPGRDYIIHEIVSHVIELSKNDYGNYVVQFVVGLKNDPHVITQVILGLEGNFVSLSKNKFGSHVVEKCLKEADDYHVNKIISEIIADSKSFLDLVQHPMGNFVVQIALHRSKEMQACDKPSLYSILMKQIIDNSAFLHSHIHGKRVLSLVKGRNFRVLS